MTSMRLFCSRYYDHLGAVWATSMFVVETVSVKLTGGDGLTGCHALTCACNNAHLTRMWRIEQVFAVRREFRTFDTGGTFDPKGAFQYQNISFGCLGWFVRECTDADPERTLLLPTPVNRPVDVKQMTAHPLVAIPESAIF